MTDDQRAVLQAWADGEIRFGEAMERTGIETFEGLLRAAEECGVVWHPELSREAAASISKAVELLRPYALECLRRRVTDWATGATSRAEGKQAMRGIDPETKRVELDFTGIDAAAPSFGDEIWRVWAREHPNTRVVAVNVSPKLYPHLRRGDAIIEPPGKP